MKKTILLAAMAIGFNLAVSAQINDEGFKKVKMGMTAEEFKELGNVTIKEDGTSKIKYGGISLKLKFGEYDYLEEGKRKNGPFLQSIETSSKEAKLHGVSENLIGKNYDELKKILGNQMSDPWEGLSDEYDFPAERRFYVKNKERSSSFFCYLSIDEDGLLEYIAVYPHP